MRRVRLGTRAVLLVLTSIVLASIVSLPRIAAAYCAFSDAWTGYDSVPVFLHPDLLVYLRHVDGSPWSAFELENEVRWALVATQDAYADLPFFYVAGFSACEREARCTYPHAVHIQPRAVPEDPEDLLFCQQSGADVPAFPVATGRTVNLNRSMYDGEAAACDTAWEHWDTLRPLDEESLGRYFTLGSILQHEFLHVLGLPDPDACPPPSCSTPPYCSVTGLVPHLPQEAHRWFRYDVNAIRWRYGAAGGGLLDQEESLDGSAWWGVASSGMPPFAHEADASAAYSSLRMFTTRVRGTDFAPAVAAWDWLSMTWTAWGAVVGTTTLHRTGAAYDGVAPYAHYLTGETESAVSKTLAEARFGAPYAFTTQASPWGATRMHGVESAYDPLSLMRVVTWRSTEGHIRVQAIHDTLGVLEPQAVELDGEKQVAFGTPSVACADAGRYNCLLVWAEAAERGTTTGHGHHHYLRWAHFEVYPTNTWRFEAMQSSTYILHGTPRATYRGPPSSPGAFVVAYPLELGGSSEVWTARKDTTPGSTFTDFASHALGGERRSFLLGAAHGYAELPIRRW